MLNKARTAVDGEGDSEMSSSKMYSDEEFRVSRTAFQSTKPRIETEKEVKDKKPDEGVQDGGEAMEHSGDEIEQGGEGRSVFVFHGVGIGMYTHP